MNFKSKQAVSNNLLQDKAPDRWEFTVLFWHMSQAVMWVTAQLAVIRVVLSSSTPGTRVHVLSHAIPRTILQSRDYHFIILKLKAR